MTLVDQFGKLESTVIKLNRMCLPTHDDIAHVKTDDRVLLCYRLPTQRIDVGEAFLNHELGTTVVKVGLLEELCAPSALDLE